MDRFSPQGLMKSLSHVDELRGRTLPLEVISLDGGTQMRLKLDQGIIHRYVEDMSRGDVFPPVDVFQEEKDGEIIYWLVDGFYRWHATRRAGLSDKIDVVIHEGTLRDAILYSCGVNHAHGNGSSNADKRRAVFTLLADPEWGKWSNRAIARQCHVDEKTVRNIRAELSAENPQIDPVPLGDDGAEEDGPMPPTAPQTRLVERQGITYEQAVSSQKRRQAQQASPPPRPAPKPAPRPPMWHFTLADSFDVDEMANRLKELLVADEARTLVVEVREG